MKIRIVASAGRMPPWVQQGYEEYTKRLPRTLRLELVELPLGRRGHKSTPGTIARARREEGRSILAALAPRDHVIALDVRGKAWSTEQLSAQLADWRMRSDTVSLMIGGPDGLDEDCLNRASQRWSLSPLTLPHPLVRVLLAEQLYRAWTLLSGHPYHK